MDRQSLATGEVYHLYNRGVDKRVIFPNDSCFARFMSILKHYLKYDYPYSLVLQRARKYSDIKRLALNLERYRWEHPLVEVLSLCLMPNHFHLQVRQLVEDGVSVFMHRLGTSYTNYFNTRNERTGRLFEGPFKSVYVESEGQFLCLNRYIHVNPVASGLANFKNLNRWPWSSLPNYLKESESSICRPAEILSYFRDVKDYLNFVLADFEGAERQSLEGLVIDDDFGWFREREERKKRLKQDLMESLRCG